MQTYVILRAGAGLTARSRTKGFGRDPLPSASLEAERLSERDAAKLRSDDEVSLICPSMPTTLPEPLAADGGNAATAWGLDAVGARNSTFSGIGVRVAVLDTGIDASHPAFADMRLEQKDFSGHGDGDRLGHGTHCAGTIFGRDLETRIGVAPGVQDALIGKILGDNGRGTSEMMFRGVQWAIEKRADIVSMSVGLDFTRSVKKFVDDGCRSIWRRRAHWKRTAAICGCSMPSWRWRRRRPRSAERR